MNRETHRKGWCRVCTYGEHELHRGLTQSAGKQSPGREFSDICGLPVSKGTSGGTRTRVVVTQTHGPDRSLLPRPLARVL